MENLLTYEPKEELQKIAMEVLEFLRPRHLPIWQVKEVMTYAKEFAEWEKMK